MKRHPVLPEPDLAPHQVVAEEKTSMFAVFGKQYVWVTIFLLVVMVLGYGGIIYGNAGYALPVPGRKPRLQRQLRLRPDGLGRPGRPPPSMYSTHCSATGLSANTLNSSAPSCSPAAGTGIYNVHSTPAVVVLYMRAGRSASCCGCGACTCTYPPTSRPGCAAWAPAGPTAWATSAPGAASCCAEWSSPRAAPLGWILLITIPGALLPAALVGIFGVRQRRRALEELAR